MTTRNILVTLLLLLPLLLPATELLDSLDHRRQELLYYQIEQLPNNLKRIASESSLEAISVKYASSRDPYVHFNLVIALAQRLQSGDDLDEAQRRAIIAFLDERLRDGNPWVRCEAIYAIGYSGLPEAEPTIRRCFEDPSDFVFLHAVLAYQQCLGQPPPIDDLQRQRFMRVHQLYGDNHDADAELDTWMRNGAPASLKQEATTDKHQTTEDR